MSDAYPSLGIKVDFAEIRRLIDGLKEVRTEYATVGKASADATIRMTTEARAALNSRMAITRQMLGEERQRAADENAFHARMMNQRTQEAVKAAREQAAAAKQSASEQAAAAKAAAAEQERTWKYLQSVRIQSFKMQEAAKKEALREETAAAKAAAREQAAAARVAMAAAGSGGGGGFLSGLVGGASGALGILHRVRMAVFDLRTAFGVLLGGMVISPIVKMADSMAALEARTRLYAVSGAQVPAIMTQIFDTAQKARTPLEGIAKLYTRLAPLSEQLGRSQGDLLRVVETVAKAFTLGGATAAEATASAQQFAQGLSSNRFGGDELRSVAENAPALLQAIAEGVNQINPSLNLNAATFIKWAQAGNATTEVMVKAIEYARPKIDAMFASMPVTVDQSMTMLKNSITNAVGEIDKAFAAQNGGVKLSTEIAMSITKLANAISSPTFVKGATDALTFISDAFKALARVVEFVANGFGVMVKVIATGAGIMAAAAVYTSLANSIRAVGVAYTVTTYQTMAATAATYALRTAWAALVAASPLIILAAVAAAFMYVSDTIKNGEKAIEEYDGAITGLGGAMSNAITVAKGYGQDTAQLTAILASTVGVTDKLSDSTSEATKLAQAKAEMDKQMAIAQLMAARATLVSIEADSKKAASMKGLFATILEGLARVADVGRPALAVLGTVLGGPVLGNLLRDSPLGFPDQLRAGAVAMRGSQAESQRTGVDARTGISAADRSIAIIRGQQWRALSGDAPPGPGGSTAAADSEKASKAAREAADAAKRLADEQERMRQVANDAHRDAEVTIADLVAYGNALDGSTASLIAYNQAAEVQRRLAERPLPAGDDVIGQLIQISSEVEREGAQRGLNVMREYNVERAKAVSLASMSTEEASEEVRVLEEARRQQEALTGLTDQQAKAMARVVVQAEILADRTAATKRTMKDAIQQAFVESGKLDFSSIREGLTRSIRQAVYDALIAEPVRIIVDAVVDVTTKGIEKILTKMTGSNGAGGNMFETISNVFKPGGSAGDFMAKLGSTGSTIASAMSTLSSSFPQLVAVYQGGSAIGSAISNVFGGNSKLGGQVGGLFGGIIGGIVGILDGKESNHGASAIFTGGGTGFQLSGNRRTAETTAAITGVAGGVIEVIKTLSALGISAGNVIKNIDIGTRDPTHIRLANGMDVRSARGDPEAALKAASLALLQYGTYQDTQMKALVDQMIAANQSFEEIAAKLDQYVTAQRVPRDLQTSLLQFSNPRAAQLRQLQDQQIERRRTIQGYAASGFYTPGQLAEINSNLTALERSEIKSVVERFADSLDGAAHSLKDFKDAQEEIAKFTRRLMTGSLSPLSQEDQLSLNRQSFITNLGRASGGDYRALTGITEDAQAYLTAAQKFFGSTEAYTNIFKEVTDALNVLSSQEIQDPMVSAIEQAAIDLKTALEAQTLALIAAIQAANNNTVDGLAGVGEAVVTTTGGGLLALSDTMVERIRYGAALNGGVAA